MVLLSKTLIASQLVLSASLCAIGSFVITWLYISSNPGDFDPIMFSAGGVLMLLSIAQFGLLFYDRYHKNAGGPPYVEFGEGDTSSLPVRKGACKQPAQTASNHKDKGDQMQTKVEV
jgi:hypothetical protein